MPTLFHETSIEAALNILDVGLISGGYWPARRYEAYPHFYLKGERISRSVPGHPHEITLFFESDMPVTEARVGIARVSPGSIVKVYAGYDEAKGYTDFWQAVIAPGSPAIRFIDYEIVNGFNCQIRDATALTKAARARRKVHASFTSDRLLPGRSNGLLRRLALHLTRTWPVSETWPSKPPIIYRPLARLAGR